MNQTGFAFAVCISLLMSCSFFGMSDPSHSPVVSWRTKLCSGPEVSPRGRPGAALARTPLPEDLICESNISSVEFSITSEMLRPEFCLWHRFEV